MGIKMNNKLIYFILISLFLLLIHCSRDWKNPYDPDVSPSQWTPENLSITVESPNSVLLTWNHSGDFNISTIIERSTNDQEYEELGIVTQKEYRDTTLLSDRKYSYRVRATITDRSSDPTNPINLVWNDRGTILWETILPGGISAADMSPDGKRIIIGDQKGFGFLLSTSTGTEKWSRKLDDSGAGATVDDLHFSYDNKLIAYGLWGYGINELGVVSAGSGSEKWTFEYDRQVVAVRFSHDDSKLASGGYDNRLRLWKTSNGSDLWNGYHSSFVEKILFSNSDAEVYSASWDHSIKKFSVSDGNELWSAEHSGEVWDIALSPDETKIVSGSSDKTIRVSNTSTGTEIWSQGCTNMVMSVDFSPDGSMVACGCTDEVKVWNGLDGTLIYDFNHPSFIYNVEFSPDSELMASCGRDGVLRIWDLDDGDEYWQSSFVEDAAFLEFSADGQYIFCGDRSGIVRYFLVNDSWIVLDE